MEQYQKKRIISGVEIGDFKGNKTISIPFGKENEAFTFGVVKAKAICKYMNEIMKFVEESDKEYAARQAAKPQGGHQQW